MSMTMAEAHRQISQIREYLHEIGHDGRTEIIAAVEVAMRSMEREMGIMQDMLAGQQITQEEIWRVTEGLRHCSAVGEFCDDCPAHLLCRDGNEQATFLREVLRVLEKLTQILETEAADRVCARSSNGDLISREHAIEVVREMVHDPDIGDDAATFGCMVWGALDRMPAVDAEPVVHCRDCMYFKWGDYCTQDKMEYSKCREDDFCSYGAKMDEKVKFTVTDEDDDMLGYRDTV